MVYNTVYHKMKVGRVVRDAAPVTRGHQGGTRIWSNMAYMAKTPKIGYFGVYGQIRVFWHIGVFRGGFTGRKYVVPIGNIHKWPNMPFWPFWPKIPVLQGTPCKPPKMTLFGHTPKMGYFGWGGQNMPFWHFCAYWQIRGWIVWCGAWVSTLEYPIWPVYAVFGGIQGVPVLTPIWHIGYIGPCTMGVNTGFCTLSDRVVRRWKTLKSPFRRVVQKGSFWLPKVWSENKKTRFSGVPQIGQYGYFGVFWSFQVAQIRGYGGYGHIGQIAQNGQKPRVSRGGTPHCVMKLQKSTRGKNGGLPPPKPTTFGPVRKVIYYSGGVFLVQSRKISGRVHPKIRYQLGRKNMHVDGLACFLEWPSMLVDAIPRVPLYWVQIGGTFQGLRYHSRGDTCQNPN